MIQRGSIPQSSCLDYGLCPWRGDGWMERNFVYTEIPAGSGEVLLQLKMMGIRLKSPLVWSARLLSDTVRSTCIPIRSTALEHPLLLENRFRRPSERRRRLRCLSGGSKQGSVILSRCMVMESNSFEYKATFFPPVELKGIDGEWRKQPNQEIPRGKFCHVTSSPSSITPARRNGP